MESKINLELKHYCTDFAEIKKALKKFGAKKIEVKNQKDYFFNLPGSNDKVPARMKLRLENNSQVLIFYKRPNFQVNKSTAADVSLYDVKDKKLLSFLQKSLGVKAIVEKKREVWKKDNTIFNIDEVKGVGKIFEVELQKKGKITKKDRAIFKSYQKNLQPFLGKVIKGSNVDLVLAKSSKRR